MRRVEPSRRMGCFVLRLQKHSPGSILPIWQWCAISRPWACSRGRPLNDVPRLLLELNRIAHPKVRARPARADPMHPAESVVSPDTAILHRLQQVAGCRTSSGQAETRFMQAGQECIAGRTHEAERVQIHVHGSTCPASRMPCARTAQTSCTHGPMSWPADEGLLRLPPRRR